MKRVRDRILFRAFDRLQGHSDLNAQTWRDRAITPNTAMPTHQPLVINLDMSDTDYLEQLAQGHDPVRAYCNQSYQRVLTSYGIPTATAAHIAPLIDKLDCSIKEKLLVNRTLKHIWYHLIGYTA